jgi:DNA-directed RNA polymerase subunit RPC12/RpoP
MKCAKCDKELVLEPTLLTYLGHTMTHDFPRCPSCGQVFIPEEIVDSKMREVEISLEDK